MTLKVTDSAATGDSMLTPAAATAANTEMDLFNFMTFTFRTKKMKDVVEKDIWNQFGMKGKLQQALHI